MANLTTNIERKIKKEKGTTLIEKVLNAKDIKKSDILHMKPGNIQGNYFIEDPSITIDTVLQDLGKIDENDLEHIKKDVWLLYQKGYNVKNYLSIVYAGYIKKEK